MDAKELDGSTKPDTLTLPELVRLAAERLSPAAKMLIFAALEALRNNTGKSRSLMRLAEERCEDESERAYVLHGAAVLLLCLGDTETALEKDKLCLDLCLRLGYDGLKADVLSQLSVLFGKLGHKDLAVAFAKEAEKIGPESTDGYQKKEEVNEQDNHRMVQLYLEPGERVSSRVQGAVLL